MSTIQNPPDEPGGQLQVLQEAADALDTLEPADLDDRDMQAVVRSLQQSSAQLLWVRNMTNPRRRPR